MELIATILLFAFLKISAIHGGNLCPVSFCGNSRLKLRYPFKLETQTVLPNNCTYFNLSCNKTQGTTTVSFPSSGDFYVQNIDYSGQNIQIYDPGNCLIERLMNFSLSSSLFKAYYYDNYTFYVCPWKTKFLGFHVNSIECLSNSTSFMTASQYFPREVMEAYGCRTVGSWLIPVSWPGQFETNGPYDKSFLVLTWNNTNVCKDCEESDDLTSGIRGTKPMTKILAITLSMPALIIMALTCCSVFCLHLIRMTRYKRNINAAAAADAEVGDPTVATPQTTTAATMPLPPATGNSGLDKATIMARTETVVLNESDSIIPRCNINTCSICLESYCPKEMLRLISKCGHCFHACCIEQWLGKNSTCPVCRTSVSDVAM